MNKSESKELGAASKRPSARRASAELELSAADATGTTARRVHARRASPEPEAGLFDEPLPGEGDQAPAPAEGIAFAARGEAVQPSASQSSAPPARARARRPGSKQASQAVREPQPSAEVQPPAAAEPAHSAREAAEDAEAAHSASPGPAPAARAHAPEAAAPTRASAAPARAPEAAAPTRASAAPARAPEAAAPVRAPAVAEPAHDAPPTAPRAAQEAKTPEPEDAAASIVESTSWSPAAVSMSASLQAAENAPLPALDHADFADDFGLDAQYETKLRPWLDSLCDRHFHVELHGVENIPARGRALLVANHSRASVWDGILLRAALRSHHPAGRVPRWLVDDQQFHAPFLGTFVNRLGAVRACQENAERLLLREELVAVFPEGSKATERPYQERYRLQRFGRGGYVKLALRTGTPVLPVAIVATEFEGAVWRNRLANASRVLAAPFAALRPGFTRIGVLGVPPISARIRIYVGAAVAEISKHDASVTQDDGLVHELNECVRSAVQNLVNASLHA